MFRQFASAEPKAKKKKKRSGPKRPLTAYQYFMKEMAPKMPAGLAFGLKAKAVAAIWKDMPEKDKVKFNEMAKKDKQRYQQEKAAMASADVEFAGENNADVRQAKAEAAGQVVDLTDDDSPVRVLKGYLVAVDDQYSVIEEPDGGETRLFVSTAQYKQMSSSAYIRQRIAHLSRQDHSPLSDHPQLSSLRGKGDYGSIHLFEWEGQVTSDSGGGDMGDGLAETNEQDLIRAYHSLRTGYSAFRGPREVISITAALWRKQSAEQKQAFLDYIHQDGVKTLIIDQY